MKKFTIFLFGFALLATAEGKSLSNGDSSAASFLTGGLSGKGLNMDMLTDAGSDIKKIGTDLLGSDLMVPVNTVMQLGSDAVFDVIFTGIKALCQMFDSKDALKNFGLSSLGSNPLDISNLLSGTSKDKSTKSSDCGDSCKSEDDKSEKDTGDDSSSGSASKSTKEESDTSSSDSSSSSSSTE